MTPVCSITSILWHVCYACLEQWSGAVESLNAASSPGGGLAQDCPMVCLMGNSGECLTGLSGLPGQDERPSPRPGRVCGVWPQASLWAASMSSTVEAFVPWHTCPPGTSSMTLLRSIWSTCWSWSSTLRHRCGELWRVLPADWCASHWPGRNLSWVAEA